MKTLKEALKKANEEALKVGGFVIDNRALCMLSVKVESAHSDEYITKARVRYKLSAEEKKKRELEDEKKTKEISKGLSSLGFLNF
jgi:hypothetical protein